MTVNEEKSGWPTIKNHGAVKWKKTVHYITKIYNQSYNKENLRLHDVTVELEISGIPDAGGCY